MRWRLARLFARLHAVFDAEVDQRLRGRDAGQPRKNDYLDVLLDVAASEDGKDLFDRETLRSHFTVNTSYLCLQYPSVTSRTVAQHRASDPCRTRTSTLTSGERSGQPARCTTCSNRAMARHITCIDNFGPTHFVRLRLFELARTKVAAQRADPNPNHDLRCVRADAFAAQICVPNASARTPNGRFARLLAVHRVPTWRPSNYPLPTRSA
uniref:Uncharacterized protein n=1 Tax=Aegilops tauschii subsp. strangulata TaxID=200361 RepID=A0A453DD75_AEGTS